MRGLRVFVLFLVTAGAACHAAADIEVSDEIPRPEPSAGVDASAAEPEAAVRVDPCDAAALAARRSLAGCRFVTTFAAGTSPGLNARFPPACHAMIVSNPSSEPSRLRLRFHGSESDPREEDAAPYTTRAIVEGRRVRYEPLDDGALGPRESAVVSAVSVRSTDPSFPTSSECPTNGFVETEEPAAREGKVTPGIELLSDRPVVALQVSPYVPDVEEGDRIPSQIAYPLIPVHLWEKAPTETGVFQPGLPESFEWKDDEGYLYVSRTQPAYTFALAAFDDTVVSLPHADGFLSEGTLQRGELFTHVTHDALTGRFASADKPVALVTYAPQAYIPWDFAREGGIDAQPVVTMALPSRAWGSEYVAVRHGDRWEGHADEAIWRVVGGADETRLTYEPYRPTGAPERIARGERAVFFATEPFVVRSQDAAHAFYLSQSMTGVRYQIERYGIPDEPRGGAVTVHQLATALWARRYGFFAVPAMPEQSLVLVRPRDGGEVRLDCAGAVTGWTPLDDRFELVRVPLTGRLYEPVVRPGVGACQAGNHWIEGDGPFWGTLWGWASNDETFAELGVNVSGAYALPLLPVGAD